MDIRSAFVMEEEIYKFYSRKPLRHDIEKHRKVHDLNNLINK